MANTRAETVQFRKIQSKISGGNISKVYYKHGVLYGKYFDLRIYNEVKQTFYATDTNKVKSKQGGKRDDSISRARVNLYRLVVGNTYQHGKYKPILATYTFADDIRNIAEANLHFKLYLERLTKYLGTRPKYVAVPELQKRKVWHFHVVFFNLPTIDLKINDRLWNQGDYAVKLEYIRGIRDIGSYCAKYMTKEMYEHTGASKKLYYCSKHLVRPIDVFAPDAIDTILQYSTFKVLSTFSGQSYTQLKYKLL